jgi:uncharacterized protein
MRKNYTTPIMAMLMIFLFSGNWGFGQVLNENFSTIGALSSQGWTATSGAGANTISVISGGLSMPNLSSSGEAVSMTTSGEDVSKPLASSINSGTAYLTFLVNVSAAQNTGDYFLHLFQGASGTNFFPRIYVKSVLGGIDFGISKTNNTPTYTGNTFLLNTTYLIVAKYTIVSGVTNDTVELFVAPSINTSNEPIYIAASGIAFTDISNLGFGAIGLRQGSASNSASLKIDRIRVANNWEDAIGFNLTSPTPTFSISDLPTITEGNTGTSTATFTVTSSTPAPVGGITFDIATADNVALAGTDYIAKALTGQAIAAGQSTYTFDVLINGDTDTEANETFNVNLSNAIGATIADAQAVGTIINDDYAITKINEIQGNGLTSPLLGTRKVQGVVTKIFTGVGSLNGFYMQEEDADVDSDPATSEGIFVFNPPTTVAPGDIVMVTGNVIEFSTTSVGITSLLTEFSPTTSVVIVSSGNPLPTPINVTLPLTNVADLEKYESMLVNVSANTGNLVVTDNFNLGRYGQLVLAANDPATNQPGTDARIDQYTQFNTPSVAGNVAYLTAVAKRTIIVDDANGSQNIDPILFGRGGNSLSASNTIRTGDEVTNVLAVLDHRFEGYRLQIANSNELNILPSNPRPATPNLSGSPTLIVGNMNMLNYFNGNGLGGGFPTPRGANTALEFTRQRDKTIQAIINSGADIMNLNEMENDGFGPNSAIQDLINGLNTAAGAGTYTFVTPPVTTVISTDEITVAMIYKPAKASPVGDMKSLINGEFVEVGRGALAQTFKQTSDGATFTLVGNHFKSKGSLNVGVGNPDINDGQANNNGQRTRQAQELAAWLATKPTGTMDPDYLIVGDLNAYAKEDPLTTLETAGYATLIPNTNTSYQFSGAHGALDHALGNASLAAQKVDAKKWNINADEPTAIDYNIQLDNGTIIKTATQIDGLYDADQYRNSDHDPVLVGLKLLCDKPTAVIESPTSGCVGKDLELVGNGGDEYNWNNTGYIPSNTFSLANGTTVTLKVKNADGCESDEVSKSVTFNATTFANATTNSQSVINGTTSFIDENCKLIATIKPSVALEASGFFNAKVWVESSALSNPFVARHYQIGPSGFDGQNGGATVTLYFTQPEFDAYNLASTSTTTIDDLPTGASDSEGIARLRIIKYPGVSSDNTGLPNTYTGLPDTIVPNTVVFEDGIWKISFDVESFSGFFVNGQTTALPVTLLSFKGKTLHNTNVLEWKTTNEKAFDGFEIQRSLEGKSFAKIGFVKGNNGENYEFTDTQIGAFGAYYRLKMNDLDGKYDYSKIIFVKNEAAKSTVGEFYPSPAVSNELNINITSAEPMSWTITSYDLAGRVLKYETKTLEKGQNKVKVSLENAKAGIVLFRIENADGAQYRKVLKQ